MFAPNGGYRVYYPSDLFRNAHRFENWGIFSDIPRFSWGIFVHVTCLDQLRASEKIWWILLYRHECFTGKYTTRKIHKNYIRDPSGLFSIISHVSLSMISLISSLSLKLYFNSLVYRRNIFGCCSKVFGNLRKSSDIFGNFQKFSENVRDRSSGLRNNIGKSSEIFGRWSEIFGKASKTPSSACLYNKKNITRRLEDMNFIFSWQKQYFTHSLRSFVKYCFATRK